MKNVRAYTKGNVIEWKSQYKIKKKLKNIQKAQNINPKIVKKYNKKEIAFYIKSGYNKCNVRAYTKGVITWYGKEEMNNEYI